MIRQSQSRFSMRVISGRNHSRCERDSCYPPPRTRSCAIHHSQHNPMGMQPSRQKRNAETRVRGERGVGLSKTDYPLAHFGDLGKIAAPARASLRDTAAQWGICRLCKSPSITHTQARVSAALSYPQTVPYPLDFVEIANTERTRAREVGKRKLSRNRE